ncbi:MAG: hypothetical protein J6B72_04680, partial [Clostridia bacterium]|nr:hypothetical protein [Clostridia bacterium]
PNTMKLIFYSYIIAKNGPSRTPVPTVFGLCEHTDKSQFKDNIDLKQKEPSQCLGFCGSDKEILFLTKNGLNVCGFSDTIYGKI